MVASTHLKEAEILVQVVTACTLWGWQERESGSKRTLFSTLHQSIFVVVFILFYHFVDRLLVLILFIHGYDGYWF